MPNGDAAAEREALRERAMALADELPGTTWHVDGNEVRAHPGGDPDGEAPIALVAANAPPSVAAFIAAARTLVPDLCAALAASEAERADLQARLARMEAFAKHGLAWKMTERDSFGPLHAVGVIDGSRGMAQGVLDAIEGGEAWTKLAAYIAECAALAAQEPAEEKR